MKKILLQLFLVGLVFNTAPISSAYQVSSMFDKKVLSVNVEDFKDDLPKTIFFIEQMKQKYAGLFDGITFCIGSISEIVKPCPMDSAIIIHQKLAFLIEQEEQNSALILEWFLVQAAYLVSMKKVFACVGVALGVAGLSVYEYCKTTGYLPKYALKDMDKADPVFVQNENRSFASSVLHGTALAGLVAATFGITERAMWAVMNMRAEVFVASTCINEESFKLIYEEYKNCGLDNKALFVSQAFKNKFGYDLQTAELSIQ